MEFLQGYIFRSLGVRFPVDFGSMCALAPLNLLVVRVPSEKHRLWSGHGFQQSQQVERASIKDDWDVYAYIYIYIYTYN